MLQRFRTLFNLPSIIRGSIAKGEYDLAVREYRKAKSIVLPSHAQSFAYAKLFLLEVGILKRVLEEVEKVMQEFRMMLFKSMEDPELDLADLENIVRLLLELEPSSDPVWRYLNIQNRRIKSLLEKCTSNHEAQMEMLHNKIRDRSKSDARWRQLQEDSTKLVQSTFRDFDESNILRSFMNDAIVEIAKTCQALEGKESAPPAAVRALHGLYFDITKIYILRLCTWMRATTKEISPDEMWSPLTTLERNKSPYTISCLPLVFQSTIISAMDRIDNLIESLKNETIKYQHVSEHIQEIQESVRLAFLNSFLGFAGYLERIGSELSQWRSNKENNPLQNGYLHNIEKELSTSDGGCAAPLSDFHRKLLIVLSNIGYCKDELSHGLYCRYKHVWLQHRDDDEQNADMRDLVTSFSALEEKVLGQYTCAKSDLIRDAAQIYLFGSGIQWGGAPTVKGIRDATVDLLHILVGVHAEVQQCSCYICL
ncbi:hypothetical protein ZIOFF_000552 [Zingiber officinale]|uniref:Exocyst complex component SEC5 n=1 Tax=Zingiber officinale TaxID=94328 RepID=A0A8J5M6N8_ZINOF|nr:hypothetical protein ZIOFF_000552 [Zingiber officinale]